MFSVYNHSNYSCSSYTDTRFRTGIEEIIYENDKVPIFHQRSCLGGLGGFAISFIDQAESNINKIWYTRNDLVYEEWGYKVLNST